MDRANGLNYGLHKKPDGGFYLHREAWSVATKACAYCGAVIPTRFADLDVGERFVFKNGVNPFTEYIKRSPRTYIETEKGGSALTIRVGTIHVLVERVQHAFTPSDEDRMYCQHCGGSETDHQV